MADLEFNISESFHELIHGLSLLQWRFFPIKLSKSPNEIRCEEILLQVDLNKLAYVCFIHEIDKKAELYTINTILSRRKNDIISETRTIACELLEVEQCEFLTLYLVKNSSMPWINILPKPSTHGIGTFFFIDELLEITKAEESDPLLLWKFSEAYTELINNCIIETEQGNLDIFGTYKSNNRSLWINEQKRPEIMKFKSEISKQYIKRSQEKRDEHDVQFCYRGKIKNVKVYNYCEYAPFYREVGDINKGAILLEEFLKPLWFVNDQHESQHPQLISSQLEMFAFWLMVLKEDIEKQFTLLDDLPSVINVIIGEGFKPELRPGDVPAELPLSEIRIPVRIEKAEVNITIPIQLAQWYAKSDNQGERYAVSCLLSAILQPSPDKDKKIWHIINRRIPIGIAKMSSMLANANNIILENRCLPAYRKLQQHEVSKIQINLTQSFGIKTDSSNLTTREEKNKLCLEIAKVLHDNLINEIKKYDAMQLLPFLLAYHEACVQERAIKQLDRPARIALFGIDSAFLFKEFANEQDRTKTALAVRCLIELIVAFNSVDGTKAPNFNDSDYLIALMYEMIAWANLADGINFGMYDPPMQFLSCGRIDVDYSSINSNMYSFGFNRTEIELDQYDSGYEDLFREPGIENIDENAPEIKEIEDAFRQELGISFFRLHDFLTDLVNLTRKYNVSVFATDEKTLRNELKKTKFNWSDSEIDSALNAMCLLQGWQIDNPPTDYRKKDTKPWHYNRALSLIRRPIAKLIKNDTTFYLWSYRHLYAAFENIYVLLIDGILWNPGNGSLTKLNKKYADKKGDEFRERVHFWLKTNSDLEVREEEVHIKPKAKLDSPVVLGDIDIFAIDHKHKIIYSLECKNTSESKSIHDFKTDIDKYLDTKGYIDKHLNRDKWLKENQEKLEVYVKNAETYQIVSIIVTAFEIPLSYTEVLPIPIISYPRLKLHGVKLLQELLVN